MRFITSKLAPLIAGLLIAAGLGLGLQSVGVDPGLSGLVQSAEAAPVSIIGGKGKRYGYSAGGGGGGSFVAGTPYFFSDFQTNVGRLDTGASKITAFQGMGWSTLKDERTNSGGAAGWIYTTTAAAAAANGELNYSGGAFPCSVDHALVLDGRPSTANDADGTGDWKQTDFYLVHTDWRPTIAVRYLEYIVPGGTTVTNNKVWYPSSTAAGGTPWGFFLINDGFMGLENDNPGQPTGVRNAMMDGSSPHNRWYATLRANGVGGAGNPGTGVLTNSNGASGPYSGAYQNEQPANTGEANFYRSTGTWYEITILVDHSGAQGKFGYWVRPVGGSSRVRTIYFEGGVTSGYDWPIPTSTTANGQTINLRTEVQILKVPTTWNWYRNQPGTAPPVDTSGEGDHKRIWCDVQFAGSLAALGHYSDDPDYTNFALNLQEAQSLFASSSSRDAAFLARAAQQGAANDHAYRLRASR